MTFPTLPQINIDELFLEIELTNARHIVVEGQTDARFHLAWLGASQPSGRLVVTPVENIFVEPDEVLSLGLTDGNRGRVVFVAQQAYLRGIRLLAIADRDCGHAVSAHDYETLCWTDYPALESYALEPEVLDYANLVFFGGKMPSGSDLLHQLTPALRELFAVRLVHPHLSRPNYSAGLRGSRDLLGFDVVLTVHTSIRAAVPTYPRPTSTEPREFAYGHDIGELMMAGFANIIKNQLGFSTLEALESALRGSTLAVGSYVNQPMFVRIKDWVTSP